MKSRLTSDLPPAYWLLWLGTLINRLGGFVIPFLTLYLTGQRDIPGPDHSRLTWPAGRWPTGSAAGPYCWPVS